MTNISELDLGVLRLGRNKVKGKSGRRGKQKESRKMRFKPFAL